MRPVGSPLAHCATGALFAKLRWHGDLLGCQQAAKDIMQLTLYRSLGQRFRTPLTRFDGTPLAKTSIGRIA